MCVCVCVCVCATSMRRMSGRRTGVGGLYSFRGALRKASLDLQSFGSSPELCGFKGDELRVLPEYRDHLVSVQSM